MILLGIIGEYVGRIYISINSAPQFIIKNTINIDDKKWKLLMPFGKREI